MAENPVGLAWRSYTAASHHIVGETQRLEQGRAGFGRREDSTTLAQLKPLQTNLHNE